MSSLSQALGYLSEVTKFASQGPVSYGMGECVCMVRPYTVLAGMLSKSDTDKLVDDYCNVKGGSIDGYGRVPVVMSLRTLVYEDPRRPAKGLLLVPAMLDINGRLSVDVRKQRPWIPLERLSAPGSAPRSVTVASLADYRHFQLEHQAEFADPVTWGVYVDLATSMFDSIAHVDPSGLADSNCRIDSELCRIKCVRLQEPTLTASNVFTYLAAHSSDGLPATLAPFFGDPAELDENSAPTLTISRSEIKRAEEEREAQASKAKEKGSEAQDQAALPAPVGKAPALPAAHDDAALGTPTEPTSLRAIDRLMENAKLRRGSCVATQRLSSETYDMLRLLCASDPDPLSCIKLPMGTEELNIAAALAAARVTDCAVQGDDEPYVLFGVSSGVFRRRTQAMLDEAYGVHPEEGKSFSPLWGSWLSRNKPARERDRVVNSFLEKVGQFFGNTPASPDAAARLLATRLRRIDGLRCELIDGYAEVRTASDLARQQEERLLALARLRDEHRHVQRRLTYWNGLAEQGRAHRALGRGRGSQREALQEAAQNGEAFAVSSKTVEEVVQKYQELIRKQEDKLASTRRETAKLELRVRRHSLSGTKGAQDVSVLVDLCKLNRAGKRELDSLFAGGDLTAEKLDRVLDRTVRPCEFWLAVHLYEARELQRAGVRPMPRWCTVATIYEIPGLVGKLTGKPPIDLLLCLRAERMRTPQALSCLALSRRAIVMGDLTGIGPRWELDSQADSDIARLTMDADGWEFVKAHELGASAPQRFFSAVADACKSLPRTSYQLHGLAPSKGAIAHYRRDAFYGGTESKEEPGTTNVYLFAEGADDAEHVGDSLRNGPEAERVVSWIRSAMPAYRKRFAASARPVCVLTPYASQAQLIRDLLNDADPEVSRCVDVRTVRQASGEGVPVVVFSGVTSVASLNGDFTFGVDSLLSVAAASALSVFAVFCGASWFKEGAEQSGAVRSLSSNASPWVEQKEPILPIAAQEASATEETAGDEASDDQPDPSVDGADAEGTEGGNPDKSPERHDASDVGVDKDEREDATGAEPTSEQESEHVEPAVLSDEIGDVEPEAAEDADSAPDPVADPAEPEGESSEVSASVEPAPDAIPTSEEPKDEAQAPDAAHDATSEDDGTSQEDAEGDAAVDGAAPRPKVFATLAQVLHELYVAGMLPTESETDIVFRWLQRDGYMMVSSARDGSIVWVPTQRGVRCGMQPQQSDDGSLWCGFSDNAAEYVLASVQLHSKNR